MARISLSNRHREFLIKIHNKLTVHDKHIDIQINHETIRYRKDSLIHALVEEILKDGWYGTTYMDSHWDMDKYDSDQKTLNSLRVRYFKCLKSEHK